MNRFEEKLALAAKVVPTQTKLLEDDADKLIARGAEFDQRRKTSFAAHHAVLDSGNKGMDALDAQLALVTNSPLPSSGGSQEEQPDPGGLTPITVDPTQPLHPQLIRAVPSRRDL